MARHSDKTSAGAARKPGPGTLCIHAGATRDPATGAVMPPIHTSVTFAQAAVGEHQGWAYTRSGNPTRDALERCLAELEGGARALAFASGMRRVWKRRRSIWTRATAASISPASSRT